MPKPEDLANMQLYSELMEEVKVRAESINTLTQDQRGIPSPLVREYCFLQLRMLCELVALGCLVANGDIVASSPASLRKAYAPAEILTRLEALHPDFFPVPVSPKFTPGHVHFDDFDRPYLTKAELVVLWSKCGDVLHRGSLKKLIGHRTPLQKDFADVGEWGQKLLNLLSAHRIVRKGGKTVFIALLESGAPRGAVQVAIGEAPNHDQ